MGSPAGCGAGSGASGSCRWPLSATGAGVPRCRPPWRGPRCGASRSGSRCRVGPQVVQPGRILRMASSGGDDQEVLSVRHVDQWGGAPRAASGADVVEQQHRGNAGQAPTDPAACCPAHGPVGPASAARAAPGSIGDLDEMDHSSPHRFARRTARGGDRGGTRAEGQLETLRHQREPLAHS